MASTTANSFDYFALGGAPHGAWTLLPHRQLLPAAAQFPSKPAVIDGDKIVTFADLDHMVTLMARGLRAHGVAHREAIVVRLDNCVETLALYFAASRAGVAFAIVNRWNSQAEIDYMMSEVGPRLVVGASGLAPEALIASGANAPDTVLEAHEDDVLAIRFSSGTTGQPKMFLSTQRSRYLTQLGLIRELNLTDADCHIVCGPLAHAALQFAVIQLVVGGTVIMKPKFDAETLWTDIEDHKVTNALVVPTMLATLISGAPPPASLRTITSLGAPLAPALKARMAEQWPNVGLFEMYGATELGMVTCLRPEEQLSRPTSVGRAKFGFEIAIFDDDGRSTPPGEIGTVYARGPTVTLAAGSAKATPLPPHLARDGWVTSGDLGHIDADGYLFLSERRADLILSGGLNVYPSEVEKCIAELPTVREVLVVGVQDEKWGEIVVAGVAGTASEDEIVAHCRGRLASYKCPRRIVFKDQLPKNASGKLRRKDLRDELNAAAQKVA